MHAAVHHVHVVEIVDSAVPIHYRCFWIRTHAACTGLMLASTDTTAGHRLPGGYRARFLEPLLALRRDEFPHFHVVRMPMAADAETRNPPVIFQVRRQFHAALKHRHLLHGTLHSHRARVVLADETLVLDAPARNLRRNR